MKQIVLITGVSSGFGEQTARLLALDGNTVYGTVRKRSPETDNVNYLLMDLTDPASVKKAVAAVLEKERRIDVLINNAGMHTGGPAETLPEDYIRMQMETNFMGMVLLTREVLPVMREQGGGRIINISSIGGLMGLPFQAFYSAAKFAVEGFSEALRMEINQFNIKVILINPGDFHTSNSANRRNYLARPVEGQVYHDQFEKTIRIIESDEGKGWEPVILARKLVKIVNCRKPRQRYIIASFEQKLAVLLKYILPGRLFRMILQDHYKVK